MIDIQKQPDYRNIPIDQVGIKNLKYPVRVLDRSNGTQHTVASINMYVDLPHHSKGTHMSRFVELLHSFRNDLELSLTTLSHILDEMKKAVINKVKMAVTRIIAAWRFKNILFTVAATPNNAAKNQMAFEIRCSIGKNSGLPNIRVE